MAYSHVLNSEDNSIEQFSLLSQPDLKKKVVYDHSFTKHSTH